MEKATSEQWTRLNRELWENFTKYNLHLPRAQRDLAVPVRGRVAFDLALEGKVPDLKFWCRADELHFLGQSPVVWFLKVHSLKSQRIIVQGFHRVHFTKDLLTPSKTAVSKCSVILIPLFFGFFTLFCGIKIITYKIGIEKEHYLLQNVSCLKLRTEVE